MTTPAEAFTISHVLLLMVWVRTDFLGRRGLRIEPDRGLFDLPQEWQYASPSANLALHFGQHMNAPTMERIVASCQIFSCKRGR